MSEPRQQTLADLIAAVDAIQPQGNNDDGESVEFQMADGLPVLAFVAEKQADGRIVVTVTDAEQEADQRARLFDDVRAKWCELCDACEAFGEAVGRNVDERQDWSEYKTVEQYEEQTSDERIA